MRILVAGAGGALGQRLVPLLVQEAHSVGALTRSENKREELQRLGATVFIADALDPAAVFAAVETFRPDTIINQLTAIPQNIDIRHFDREFALTNRLRTEGNDNLLRAAQRAGATRFIAQSFTGWPYAPTGGPIKTETDPLDPNPPKEFRNSLHAIRHLEAAVLDNPHADGIVLRYAGFYGPGTAISKHGSMIQAVKKRMLPIVAGGTATWSFLHIDDAASATIAALYGPSGIYNIADDHPALARDWITHLAEITASKPPLKIPAWLARPLVGEHGVMMMRDARGASNAKAKRDLGWNPTYPDWKEGFRKEIAS